MVKKLLASIVIVMLVVPAVAVRVVSSDAGFALLLMLFFAIDPVFSVVIGFLSGRDIKRRWYLPAVSSLVFLAACWMLFEFGETSFALYAGIYLLLGLFSMAVSRLVFRRRIS